MTKSSDTSHQAPMRLRAARKQDPRTQFAALPYRRRKGQVQVLLITSLDTDRWILPKGWPGRSKDGPRTALAEAWEEAGLEGARVVERPIGEYEGVKRHDSGLMEPCRVLVYELEGGRLVDDYPEAGQRMRRWAPATEAASLVEEPALRRFLSDLAARSVQGR